MIPHSYREETQLFPYIQARSQSTSDSASKEELDAFDSADEAIEVLEQEHDNTGDRLEKTESLSNQFRLPGDACSTDRAFYGELQEFVEMTREHVFLENHILFPRIKETKLEIRNT